MPPSADSSIETRHLRLVSAIAEFGNLTAAGRALGLTQPALSHQLRDLEQRLRTPLFVRTARRMVPTQAGEQLLQVARVVLDQLRDFERHVVDGTFDVARGALRLATECYTAYHWLPAVLRGFRGRWPGIALRVAAEHTANPIGALREGAVDLAIVYHRLNDKRVHLEPLFDDELLLVTPPGHALAQGAYAPVEALRDEHLFVYTSADRGPGLVQEILDAASVAPAELTRIQLTEAIVELVSAGLGVAILARWAVAPAMRAGTVDAVRLGKNGQSRTWFAATRSDEVAPAYRFDLVALLRQHMTAMPAVGAPARLRLS